MPVKLRNLLNCVRRGIMEPHEALAHYTLTPAERAELRVVLIRAGELEE